MSHNCGQLLYMCDIQDRIVESNIGSMENAIVFFFLFAYFWDPVEFSSIHSFLDIFKGGGGISIHLKKKKKEENNSQERED